MRFQHADVLLLFWMGRDSHGEVLTSANVRIAQVNGRWDGEQQRGFGEMLRQIGKPKPSYDERVRAVVAQLLAALPSLDRIIDERSAEFYPAE